MKMVRNPLSNLFATLFCLWGIPVFAADFASLHQDLGPVPAFSLTERGGKQWSDEDLRGKVWIASFFYTTCAGDCNKTMPQMARLQQIFAGKRDVMLVSFSVHPEQDTPELLRTYAQERGADPEQWLFLTGTEEVMYDLIQNGFHQSVLKVTDAKPGYEILHDFKLMVVDRDGTIRGYIDGRQPAEVDRLVGRVRELARSRYLLPAVNASLNATCTVLLLLGFAAIRRRQITLHKLCMATALVVSFIFLASYVYFHFHVLGGQPTRFLGQGWVRPIYFSILLSHTMLAAVVAPLALTTAYFGFRDRLTRHVRLARWTLPMWLYVAITGVVVYWMLYHLYPPF